MLRAVDQYNGTIWTLTVILVASLVMFIVTREYATYRNSTDLRILQIDNKRLREELDSYKKSTDAAFDDLYRSIPDGTMVQKNVDAAIKRRPLGIEAWMLNRDKELRASIRAEHVRIAEVERRLHELEKEQ